MPLLIPLVAAAALFSFILLPGEGLLDFYLHKLGLPMVNWLGDPDLALGSVIGITVWKNTGYYMLFFLAGLAGVPQELLDAARIDGAGGWRRFRSVTLPMLGPTFGVCPANRPAQCVYPNRPAGNDHPGRPIGRHQPAALLHLSTDHAELRHRARLISHCSQRRGAADTVAVICPCARARDPL